MKKDVVSIRLDKKQLERLGKLAREQNKEKSALVRELVELGLLHFILKQYREGKISLGVMARELGLTVPDAVDLLVEQQIESPVEYEDFLEGIKTFRG